VSFIVNNLDLTFILCVKSQEKRMLLLITERYAI